MAHHEIDPPPPPPPREWRDGDQAWIRLKKVSRMGLTDSLKGHVVPAVFVTGENLFNYWVIQRVGEGGGCTVSSWWIAWGWAEILPSPRPLFVSEGRGRLWIPEDAAAGCTVSAILFEDGEVYDISSGDWRPSSCYKNPCLLKETIDLVEKEWYE